MSTDTVISACGLAKHYGAVRAVEGIDLHVRRGEVYGFLGRNGSGKTTTIRMLLGLIRPTAGKVTVLGARIKPGMQSIFARVGYLVEVAASYPNLTVRENLDIQRRLMDASPSAVNEVIVPLGLDRYAARRAGHLSLGNKQRLALARALLNRPEVLILDEPVNGLDPAGILEIRKLLRRLADERGVTIFLSSHILSEIAQLADRIGIIHEGRIVEDLSREELHERSRRYLTVAVSDTSRATTLLSRHLGIADVEHMQEGVLHVFDGQERTAEIARLLVTSGLDVTQLCRAEEDLEDYFMRLTGGAA